jgi:hypothetical protein
MTKKLLLAAVAAASLAGGTLATATPSQAQVYFGAGPHWGGSPYWRGHWGGGHWGGGHWGYGRWHRPVGFYHRHHYGYPYGYYRRRSSGGAIAAGLIGGFALGALAASAARPAYYYPATFGTTCWIERRRAFDPWGRLVIQRVQVCG